MNMNFAISHRTGIIIKIQALVFFLFIAAGISGSSISNIRGWASGLLSVDDKVLIGHPQGIRSDEWAVNTLMAVGQYENKEEKNPRLNGSLGPTPRDMSIIHDTGVPTSELSSISKMNLWGFFIFDLRRALAWDWWIPVFISLNGVWLLLNLLCPGQSLFNFSLALLLTFAPLCVVWSNWPALHVGTASLAVSLAILALSSRNMLASLTLAFLTGLLLTWFALQLYLPRLIPVVLVSAATYIGYCISSRRSFFTRNNIAYIIYTALIAALLLAYWFSDNYDAISRMLNSSYPGQRRIYGGTAVTSWDLDYARGWLFPLTLDEKFFADCQKMAGNPSESTGSISLFIPVLMSVLCYSVRCWRRLNCIVLLNAAVLLLFIAYGYLGLPEILGKLTFLNRSTPARSVIGLGFASVILLSFIYKYRDAVAIRHKIVPLAVCLLPFVVFFCRNRELVSYLAENELLKFICIVFFIAAVHFIFVYRIRYVTAALLLFVLPFTLFWNPLIVAPSSVKLNLPAQMSGKPADLRHGGRILVMTGDFVVPNIFLASGEKVMNATSHYVDPYMFEHFYSKLENPEIYNRFNHLIVSADSAQPPMGITLGGGDWIHMRLNAHDFDFSTLPADYVVTRNSPAVNDLKQNQTLSFIGNTGDFYFYRVKP